LATVFPLIPRRRVLGLAFGGVRSVRRGIGSDVASTREYRPGDDVAWMDWAASAKLSAARTTDEFIVRERFADESPRVVTLCDRRPSMSVTASPLRELDKPQAILDTIELISASAEAARSLTGYIDYAEGDAYWLPPRSEARAEPGLFERPFGAPADTVARGLDFLGEHKRDLPTQAFVFVISDFAVRPELSVWQSALEHRWEIVPVIVQDRIWERSFPDIGGVAIPYADVNTGKVVPVHLSRGEADRLREQHEAAWDERLGGFRTLGIEPVVVHEHGRGAVLDAFLRWADLRVMWRGAVA